MDWACLNDAPAAADDAARAAKRTQEAEESRLATAYESALRNAASGDADGAIDALRRVLNHALTNRPDASARLTRVRYLALKNLGKLLERRGASEDADEALRCYARAVEMDDRDGALWGRLGKLACARGELGVGRMAYERAVTLSPRNQLFLEELSELCLSAGDFESAKALASVVASIDPANERARTMKRAPESLEPSRAMKASRTAALTPAPESDELAIRFGSQVEKSWEVIAAVLARLGGFKTPESTEVEAPVAVDVVGEERAKGGETPGGDVDVAPATPSQSKELVASPSVAEDDDDNESVLVSSLAACMKTVEGVDIPRDMMGRKIRFVFETPAPLEPTGGRIQASPESIEVIDVTMSSAVQNEPQPSQLPSQSEPPVREREPPVREPEPPVREPESSQKAAPKEKSAKPPVAPVRKSRRQEELDAKKAIEDEKARIIAEQEAAQKAAEREARRKDTADRMWKAESNISRVLLNLIGAEDPVVAAVKRATTDVAGAADRALSLKKKHQKELKEAAAKKAEIERQQKTLRRVSSFVAGIDDANGGAAHVAWRFLSTTAARWRPDAEDDCAPDPWTILTLYNIFGAGPGDELAPRTRVLLCLADTSILAARACALGQSSRKFFRNLAVSALEKASVEMDGDLGQDFQAESLFLRHKLADLDGEEPSASKFYLEQAHYVAPDDSEVPPPPKSIDDAAPVRFSKQSLRAAMDAMKVKEVVTGAASRFAKGQTAELVSTLTPLLLPDEDQFESMENLDVLSLTQSEKQDALKVLAAAAKQEGPSCVIVQLKALKMVYDLTKDHNMLRLMAEAVESTSSSAKFSKYALDTVEALGLQSIAASLFEVHYNELAREPGVIKKNKPSRLGTANLEASAQLIAAVQYTSKAKDAEVIELHEKLHERLADCRCCCGEGRKGVFLRSSLNQLAKCRNRITKAREQRHASDPANQRKTKVSVMKRVDSQSEDVGGKNKDGDDDDEPRRRVRRQRSSVSSVQDEDRTPQDRADRKLLDRLDTLIVQLCYCLYGFELQQPGRRCRNEGGACESMLKITTEQEAADLWLSIQPYAMANKDTEQGRNQQIANVLKAIRDKIEDPPSTANGGLLEKYLVTHSSSTFANIGQITEEERELARALIKQPTADQTIASTRLNSMPGKTISAPPTPIQTPSRQTAASTIKSAEEKIVSFANVYRTLFQFCAELDLDTLASALEEEQSDVQDILTLIQSLLAGFPRKTRKALTENPAGEEESVPVSALSAEVTKMCKLDIEYNPTRPQSWIALADHLDNVKDIALNDAAKIMSVATYRASSQMSDAVKMVQLAIRRTLIAAEEALIMTHYAGHPETEWVRSQIYDRLGQMGYELIQDAPPIYDSRKFACDKTSAEFAAALQMSKVCFTRAKEGYPDNWMYPYMLAKLAKKSGESLQEVLELHAEALRMMPGCLELIYQVANVRLRLLMSISVDGRKKMNPESQAITLSVLKHPFLREEMQNSWIGAYRDCVEALLFIHVQFPKFHKANYRLAWSRLKKSPGEIGHCRKALEYLHPLFRVARTGTFKVCMVEIDDTNLRTRVPATKLRDADGKEYVYYESGIYESRRRFIANIRRSLRLYLALLYTLEDAGTLSAALSYMSDYRSNAKVRVQIMSTSKDVRFFALGLMLRAVASTLSQSELSDDMETQRGDGVPPHKREVFLEHAYNVWFEFAIPGRGNTDSWEQNVDEAFSQLQTEKMRQDGGPELIQEPYQTAFFSASEIMTTSPSLNFEQFALERVRLLEAKCDMSALATQLSLCQNRIKDADVCSDPKVKELGSARGRTLLNALKDAFIRCSAKTIDLLASGEIKLQPAVLEQGDKREEKSVADAGDERAADDEEAIEAGTSPLKSASTNFSEIVLITARRLHQATKSDSAQRVNEFIAERRTTLQSVIETVDSGSALSDVATGDVLAVATTFAELKKTLSDIERLKKLHMQLVEKAMSTESQAADPEQLKLVRAAYEDLTAANEKLERLKLEDAQNQTKYRENTAQIAQEMAKSDITNAESTEFLLRVMSAIARRKITDVDECEREAETTAVGLRKYAADLRKKTGRTVSRPRKKSIAPNDTNVTENPTATEDAPVAAPVAVEDAERTVADAADE